MTIQPANPTNGDPDHAIETTDAAARTPATASPSTNEPRQAADASDVVAGAIGSARLKGPSAPGIRGADVEELGAIAITPRD
jgi:hypothetical protein